MLCIEMARKNSLNWSDADLAAYQKRVTARSAPVVAPPSASLKPLNPMEALYALGRVAKGDMNKTEAAYADRLEQQKAAGTILDWKFHAIRVRLAKNTFYEPDFMVMTAGREIQIHEVKGGFTTKEGQTKIKLCAEILPWFRVFKCSKQKDGNWTIQEFNK